MATTKTKTTELKVPGLENIGYYGMPMWIFQKDITAYKGLRLGSEIDLVLDNGTKVKATVQETRVSPLIDLIVNTGGQSVYTYGRAYSPNTLAQILTDQVEADVLDVTEIYTGISVTVPMPSPAMPA